jgi:membrane protease YdiL (CAAX protease family)
MPGVSLRETPAPPRAGLLARHPLVAYFILAYALTWAIELPLVATVQRLWNVQVPMALHYLTAYGPLLAAFIVTGATTGAGGIRELVGRMLKWRVGLGWVLFAIFSPLAAFVLVAAVLALAGRPWPDWGLLGQSNFLPDLGILGAWVMWTLTSGFGEETGWRGYALPRLQKNRSALAATLVLSVFWIGWHVPAFFYLPNYAAIGLAGFPMMALGIIAGAIVFTWLYNSTGGSILMVTLWHGSFNLISASKAGQGEVAAIASALVMVWAVIVVIVFKPGHLSRSEKHTLET